MAEGVKNSASGSGYIYADDSNSSNGIDSSLHSESSTRVPESGPAKPEPSQASPDKPVKTRWSKGVIAVTIIIIIILILHAVVYLTWDPFDWVPDQTYNEDISFSSDVANAANANG
ncbi:MAG: hypothetical protein LUB61_07280 [Eggerthellaceae bacterium]|nr:hypothetical protein [Eggerthellaceae bacterium]